MGIIDQDAPATTSSYKNKRTAAAYVNLHVVGKNGQAYKLGGIPIYEDAKSSDLHKALMKLGKVGESVDLDGLVIAAAINVIDTESKELELI